MIGKVNRTCSINFDVTEFFELAPVLPMRIYWAIAGKARGRTNSEGMATTLERIKAVVERV